MALRRLGYFTCVFIVLFAGISRTSSQSSDDIPDTVMHMPAKTASGCSERLRGFVEDMDEKLVSSSSIDPLQEMVRKYFPLSGCNVEEAISIARTSKYFDHVNRAQKDVVIVFRRKNAKGWGFKVIFGLSRDTGDSILPAAHVDMLQQ
jgi:hypothetical protein